VAGDPLDAIAADDVDAVLLATPGPTHEKQLLACLEHRKPVLCEKPLTTDVDTSLEIVRREGELETPLIQVGFMRRFDPEYQQLKALIDGGELGQPLVMHCVHRNPAVPPSFDSAMIVKDSLVHEVDVTRFLLGEEIASVQIIRPTPNSAAPAGLLDPQVAIFRTQCGRHVDVEVFVTTGVGYEVRTEVVGERGSATIGLDVGLIRKSSPAGGADTSHQGSGNASASPTTSRCSGGPTPSARASMSSDPRPGTATPPRPCAPPGSGHWRPVKPSPSNLPKSPDLSRKRDIHDERHSALDQQQALRRHRQQHVTGDQSGDRRGHRRGGAC
jgi:hypothetical protein